MNWHGFWTCLLTGVVTAAILRTYAYLRHGRRPELDVLAFSLAVLVVLAFVWAVNALAGFLLCLAIIVGSRLVIRWLS